MWAISFVSVRPETTNFEKDLQAKLSGLGGASGKTGAIGSALSKLGEGVAVGLVAAIGGSVALAVKFQSVTADIAANANISISAAQKIGKAFLSTAGSSIFSANQLGEAYAAVAAQLGTLQGHALSAKQALDFMKISSDLAEASGESLADTTSSLAAVLQAFQIPLKGANAAATDLFNTSRLINVPISSLSSTIDRLHSRLGVAAPSLTTMSALLVDLGEHGVSGSRGLLVINSALNTLLNSSTTVSSAVAKSVNSAQNAVTSSQAGLLSAQQRLAAQQSNLQAATQPTLAQQQELADATTRVTQAQQALAASADPTIAQQNAVANAQSNLLQIQQRVDAQGHLTVAQQNSLQLAQDAVSAATLKNSQAVATLKAAQDGLSPSLSASVQGAEQLGITVFDSAGKFVGLRDVIAQLQPKLKEMTQQQQLQALASVFGKNANKALLDTVLAGPAAFDKAREAVTRFTLQQAAAKQLGTLKHQLDVVRASVTDVGIEFGEKFVPILEKVAKALAEGIQWLLKNKVALIALGATLGGIATVSLVAFGLTLKDKLVSNLVRVAQSFGLAGKSATETEAPVDSLNEVLISLQATLERLQDSLPALDVELDTVSVSFEDLATATSIAGDEIATSAEVAAEGVDTALGSTGVGLILIGLGLAVTLLLTHWKTVMKGLKEAVDIVVAAFRADFGFIKGLFDDVVGFVKRDWEILAGIILLPIAPILVLIGVFVKFHKQITELLGDALRVVERFGAGLLHGFADAGKFLFDVGKKIIEGLVLGLLATSPLFWIIKYRTQVLGFFDKAGTWLVDIGKKLIDGLIKGAIDAPLHGLEDVGKKIIGGFKSVLHVFSPSTDTEPIGKGLVDGIMKGIDDNTQDLTRLLKGLTKLIPAITKLAKEMTKAFGAGLTPGDDTLAGFGAAVTKGIGKALDPALASAKKFGEGFVKYIADPLAKAVFAVVAFQVDFTKAIAVLGNGLIFLKAFEPAFKPAVKALDDLGLAFKRLGEKITIPEGLTKALKAFSAVGRDVHPEVLFAAFLTIDKGVELLKPLAPCLDNLADSIRRLGRVRLPKELAEDIKAIGGSTKDLHPELLFVTFDFIAAGVKLIKPLLPNLDDIAKAIKKLGDIRLPKGLSDDLKALGKTATELKPTVFFATFQIIDAGLKLVSPLVPVLDKLCAGLDKLGKVRLSKELTKDLKDLSVIATKLNPEAIFAAFLIIGNGIRFVKPLLPTVEDLTKGFEKLGKTRIPDGLRTDLDKLKKATKSVGECLAHLSDDALKAGKKIMDQLAKGIESGAAVVKAAVEKVSIAIGNGITPRAGGAAAGGAHGSSEVKKELLTAALAQNTHLTAIANSIQSLETVSGSGIATARTDATQLLVLTRSTASAIANILERELATMTAELVVLAGTTRLGVTDQMRRDSQEVTLLTQSLAVDRLHLTEARTQTQLLRDLLVQAKSPQTITLKPSTSAKSSGSSAGLTGNQIAKGVLT